MSEEVATTAEPLIDVDPVSPAKPASGADENKPNEVPASDADAQNPEDVAETPEQQEAKRESRRARSNARKAAELATARTEARLLREQNAKLEAQLKPQPETGEPKRDQFEDYEAYLRAVTKYDAEQVTEKRLKTEREANQRREQQGKATAGEEKTAQEWQEREKTFQAATKDYEEVVAPYVEEDLGLLSDAARRFIVDSDAGPQLLYQLAGHPDIAERIAALSPLRQVAELGKLETPTPVVRKASNAPAPIKPVGQGRSAPNGYSENMSDAEYKTWRAGQGARWAR